MKAKDAYKIASNSAYLDGNMKTIYEAIEEIAIKGLMGMYYEVPDRKCIKELEKQGYQVRIITENIGSLFCEIKWRII